ncbi:MAG: hypothetical protein QM778_12195 [Myxococcales bacterium]
MAWSTTASPARAHAPLPRQVLVTPDAAAIALDLPGFGLLLRARANQPFVYACSALLELVPNGDPPSLAFAADGSLLVGTQDGLLTVSPQGCPLESDDNELRHVPVRLLALQSVAEGAGMQVGYALTGGEAPALWRSDDGGRHWTWRSELVGSSAFTALVMRSDRPDQLYLSSADVVYASEDGGASLQTFSQEGALTLLHAEDGGSSRLWAIARDAQSLGNRGFAILRAEAATGPWLTMLRVNYFGGFAVDPQRTIWVGDEIGGVYRSLDGGETFSNLASEADVACLAPGGSALWTCNPGTPQEPVLQLLEDGASDLHGVVTLAEVDQLVSCPGLDVARTCAGAWAEWQRDVLMRPVESPTMVSASDAGESSELHPRGSSGGCAVGPHSSGCSAAMHGLLIALALCARSSRRARVAREP